MAKKRKRHPLEPPPPPGRPSKGIKQEAANFWLPFALGAAIRFAARAEGITVAEWWRRAARERLGWPD